MSKSSPSIGKISFFSAAFWIIIRFYWSSFCCSSLRPYRQTKLFEFRFAVKFRLKRVWFEDQKMKGLVLIKRIFCFKKKKTCSYYWNNSKLYAFNLTKLWIYIYWFNDICNNIWLKKDYPVYFLLNKQKYTIWSPSILQFLSSYCKCSKKIAKLQ